jgi:hypothetical protein
MKFFTVTLLAVTAIIFSAAGASAEEPEPVNSYNVPETTIVPLSLANMHHEVVVADGEKSAATQATNAGLHTDENNRLVGLSN